MPHPRRPRPRSLLARFIQNGCRWASRRLLRRPALGLAITAAAALAWPSVLASTASSPALASTVLPSTAPAGTASAAAAPAATVTQPAPPVSASAFPVEPSGTAPADGDGLIPNPATPAGAPIAAPASCTVTFTAASGGSTSAAVNSWIAAHENSITATTVVCLSGTFTTPVQVWAKSATALLEIAPAPGSAATLSLGQVAAADTNPNQFWPDSGGVSIVDSRSVEIYGLTVQNYTFNGTAHSPAGIYVTVRSDTASTSQSTVPHLSACFLNGGTCGDIYLIDNTVQTITNTADENSTTKADCGNGNVDGYGIAVIAAGSATSQHLQHLVIEGNTVTGTRTGQSETVTINGAVTDFLAAGNVIHDADNIGLDTIGWETGTAQASHGLISGNTVYNVDTWSNDAYGKWSSGACVARPENAAGIYDDGAAYIWISDNTVWNTDQGINLDVETNGKETDHLLVSGNTVYDDPGTAKSDPSTGTNPPGFPGASSVAGHDPFALYIDAFGSKASITDVYVHDNTLRNQSQYYLTPGDGMPVADLGGLWSNVQIWHNTIEGLGATDRYNPLLEVDKQPSGGANTVDCNDYANLSAASNTVNGNFALPSNDWLTLADWQAHNGHGWDADSATGGFSAACPAQSLR
jgi:phage terminase large subunit-like protein